MIDHGCPDCQACPSCGQLAYCTTERHLLVPCPHHGYCAGCNLMRCIDCQDEAEAEIRAAMTDALAQSVAILGDFEAAS